MALDPSQMVSAAATGLILGLGKLVEVLGKRKRVKSQARQLDRMEAKVDALIEDAAEMQHRLARIEDVMGFTPTERRRIRAQGLD